MKRRLLLPLLAAAAWPAAAELQYGPLPSVRSVLDGIKAKDFQPAKPARAVPRKLQTSVQINVSLYDNGECAVYDNDLGIDLRLNKIWRDEFDYRIYGKVGSADFEGEARSRFTTDPSWGYYLRGEGYDAELEKRGWDWNLRGSYETQDASGAVRKESFSFHLERDAPNSDRYRVWDEGLNLWIDATPWSASLHGNYDRAAVGDKALAILGMAAGLVNQPKLRRDPRRL